MVDDVERQKESFEGDEWEVIYKKLRTINRRLYVLEEENDELYAKIEKLEKERGSTEEVEQLKKEVEALKKKQEELIVDIDDLQRCVADVEEDIKKIFEELDDLKSYTTKAFAIAKKVERHLGIEDENEKGKKFRRRRE